MRAAHRSLAVAAALLACALSASAAGPATAPASLDNGVLRVDFDPATGALAVLDRRCGRRWDQVPVESAPAPRQRLTGFDPGSRSLSLECDMPASGARDKSSRFAISIQLSPDRAELTAHFQCADSSSFPSVRYPYVFCLADEDSYILYPHAEGMIVPVSPDDPHYLSLPAGAFYGGTRAYLACVGLVNLRSGVGHLAIFDTVEPAMLRWPKVRVNDRAVVAPQIEWQSNRGAFDHSFQVRWLFSDQGGYVSLAQLYRQWFAEKGLHRTLREKAKALPQTQTLVGSTIFWALGKPDDLRFAADAMKADGMDRVMFAVPVEYYALYAHQEPRRPELQDLVRHIRSLGYCVYRYDQVRDAFRRDWTPNVHFQVNTDAWPDSIVRRRDGKMLAAFGPESGVICPTLALGFAQKHIPQDLKTFDYNAWFMDCFGSVNFDEGVCWSRDHPSDLYVTRRAREEVMRYVNSLGAITGTECGLDYLLPWVHWYEGTTTLVNWVNQPVPGDPDPTGADRGTISLSPRYRIPFYSLVHHDEVVTTWRWEDGMPAPPAQWWRKNLWSMLSGASPMYRVYPDKFRKWRPQIAATHRLVAGWAAQVGWDQMVSHRFVTPDRNVQESIFSSGRGIVVNFGPDSHRLADGALVCPRGFLTFREGAHRRYDPPPATLPAVDISAEP